MSPDTDGVFVTTRNRQVHSFNDTESHFMALQPNKPSETVSSPIPQRPAEQRRHPNPAGRTMAPVDGAAAIPAGVSARFRTENSTQTSPIRAQSTFETAVEKTVRMLANF